MRKIGILFQDDMARAILDNRKTLTSRLRGLDLINERPDDWTLCPDNGGDKPDVFLFLYRPAPGFLRIRCPYGQPGDTLVGRECWAVHPEDGSTIYRADRGGDYQGAAQGLFKWRSSMVMPWSRSRLRLPVVRTWPSRLQDMSYLDCEKEGLLHVHRGWWVNPYAKDPQSTGATEGVDCYRNLWDRINGKTHPWASNPWVWRIEFARQTP